MSKLSTKIGYGSNKSKRCFATETTNTGEQKVRRTYDDIWYGDTSSISSYIRSKVKMLKNEMLIDPTEDEIRHLLELRTHVAIDNAVHSIIERHWSKW